MIWLSDIVDYYPSAIWLHRKGEGCWDETWAEGLSSRDGISLWDGEKFIIGNRGMFDLFMFYRWGALIICGKNSHW